MKVKRLFIKDYNQFKDFELDLTYPAGHPKAGQPLDKVCIIGQSGTGKTTLLNKIQRIRNSNMSYLFYSHPITKSDKIKNNGVDIKPEDYTNKSYIHYVDFDTDNECQSYENGHLIYKNGEQQSIIGYPKTKFIEANAGNKDLGSKLDYWDEIVKDIVNFRELEIQFKLEIAELLTSQNSNSEKIQEELQKYNQWINSISNPIKDLSENYLDKILINFNLRVRQNLDFKKTEDIATIKIETLNGIEVPNALLSTGTKQIILTTLPLYASKPENTIILFDEPERSLYPDIQSEIVNFYMSLVKDCQFFFATHSPLIASCFEPWEIVELKFNPDGSVYRELYYDVEKGNHVDNYTIDPRYLRWDSILTRLFDLDKDSNEARTRKLMELATLRSKLQKANGKLSAEEKQKLQTQFEKLAELLDWEYDAEN
jgi:ABC-type lipoprotein export system ATPase subunit